MIIGNSRSACRPVPPPRRAGSQRDVTWDLREPAPYARSIANFARRRPCRRGAPDPRAGDGPRSREPPRCTRTVEAEAADSHQIEDKLVVLARDGEIHQHRGCDLVLRIGLECSLEMPAPIGGPRGARESRGRHVRIGGRHCRACASRSSQTSSIRSHGIELCAQACGRDVIAGAWMLREKALRCILLAVVDERAARDDQRLDLSRRLEVTVASRPTACHQPISSAS